MDAFNNKRPRCPNWTEQDKIVLVKNIRARKDILLARNKGDVTTKEAINAAWHEVLEAVNAESHFPRTLEQVKKQHENLKLRAKQLYMDMLQCTGAVKPHIVSPVMQMMIDDFTDPTNPLSFSLSLDEVPNPSPVGDKLKLLLPKTTPTPTPPPLTPAAKATAGSSIDNEDAGSSNDTTSYDQTSHLLRHSGRFGLHNGANISFDSDDFNYRNPKRRKLDDNHIETNLVDIEMEKIKAETEKLRAETELIYQRKECEFAIFELKRRVLDAKLEYYTKENEKRYILEQSIEPSYPMKSKKSKSTSTADDQEDCAKEKK